MFEDFETEVTAEDIQVVEPVEVGTLEDLKKIKTLIPPTTDVTFRIKNAKPVSYKEGAWRVISLGLVITEGIEINEQIKHKGAMLFTNIPYYADKEIYKKPFVQNDQHLLEWKALKSSVNLSNSLRVDDSTFEELPGQFIVADIKQVEETRKDEQGNKYKTGEIINEVKNIKAPPIEESV